MKKTFRLVVIGMTTLFLASCNRFDKAGKIIIETLEARYNDEFVINSMGGTWGTYDDTTIKAYVSPVSDKTKEFKAQIKKDFSNVTDEYMSIIVSDYLKSQLKDLFKTIYPNYYLNVIAYDTPTNLGSSDININQYIMNKEDLEYIIHLYVKTDFEFHKQEELNNILRIVESYNSLGYKRTRFNVFYLKEETFEEFDKVFSTIEDVYNYYWDLNNAINYINIDTDKVDEINLNLFKY